MAISLQLLAQKVAVPQIAQVRAQQIDEIEVIY